jgi:hypothetical protein
MISRFTLRDDRRDWLPISNPEKQSNRTSHAELFRVEGCYSRFSVTPGVPVEVEPYILILTGAGLLILLLAWLPMLLKELPLSLPILSVAVGFVGTVNLMGV